MQISSPAFESGHDIPDRFTCEDRDVSPPLEFRDVPEDAAELVLVVDDPDAPGGTFTHWMVWNLDPKRKELQEGTSGDLDAREGTNDFDEIGWRGPCPPEGDEPHTYRFILYAVDEPVELTEEATREELDDAIDGHVLDSDMIRAEYVIPGT